MAEKVNEIEKIIQKGHVSNRRCFYYDEITFRKYLRGLVRKAAEWGETSGSFQCDRRNPMPDDFKSIFGFKP